MKNLWRIFVVLVVLAGGFFAWFQQSVHYALLELGRAFRERDVATVEKHLDLSAMLDAYALFAAEVAREEGRKLGGDLLGELMGGLAGVVTKQLGEAVRPDAVQKLKRRVAAGEALEVLGPFVPAEGYRAIGAIRSEGPRAEVVFLGTCYEEVASVKVVFERVPGPLGLDWLGTWRATGVDPGSVRILAATCREGAAKTRAR